MIFAVEYSKLRNTNILNHLYKQSDICLKKVLYNIQGFLITYITFY